MKIQLEGAALVLARWGLHAPDPASPSFEKNDLPANLFLLHISLQTTINLHWHFNLSNITHILPYFSKIKACMGVIYFLICVRKHESNLSTNIRTTAGEENIMIYQKMWPFEWNHFPALFYDSVVCFLLSKCVFFYQWCLSCFPSEHYVSMFFVKQCW